MPVQRQKGRLKIRLGDVALDVHLSGKNVAGIGKVRVGQRLLRSDEELILPAIMTPDGLSVKSFELTGVLERGGTVIIRTRPVWQTIPKMEWTEHAMQALTPTETWSREIPSPKSARFDIVLKAAERTLDGRDYRGFQYGFSYRCKGRRIYQILDRATWELSGSVVGNTLIMRNLWVPPVVKFKRDTQYTTCWFFPGSPANRNATMFQLLPLYAELQGFTFQHDDDGTLVTVHERPSHVRSLFQRRKGSALLMHLNQFCFDLTDSVDTPPRQILYAERPKGDDETAIKNHFLRLRDTVSQEVREHYGFAFQPNRVLGKIEVWYEVAKMERFPEILECFNRWGLHRVFLMPLWPCPTTEINTKIKGVASRPELSKLVDWDLGNICTPLSMDIAQDYGSYESFKKLMDAGRKNNVEFFMWFGGHFSRLARLPIEDPWARDQCGQQQRNNYEGIMWIINIRNPQVADYIFENFKKLKKLGLAGIFRDSHYNMCVDTINYLGGPSAEDVKKMPQPLYPEDALALADVQIFHDAEAEMQRRIQQELRMIYYVESLGVFSVSWSGTRYEQISGNEWMFQDVGTGCDPERTAKEGRSYEEAYFRAMACRLSFAVQINPNTWQGAEASRPKYLTDEIIAMNHGFSRVENDLCTMSVLPADTGIHWTSADCKTETYFAYKSFEVEVPDGATVRDAIADADVCAGGGKIKCEPRRIYQVDSR